jgi:hypothetical protein
MDVQFDKKFTEVTRNGSLIYESAFEAPGHAISCYIRHKLNVYENMRAPWNVATLLYLFHCFGKLLSYNEWLYRRHGRNVRWVFFSKLQYLL